MLNYSFNQFISFAHLDLIHIVFAMYGYRGSSQLENIGSEFLKNTVTENNPGFCKVIQNHCSVWQIKAHTGVLLPVVVLPQQVQQSHIFGKMSNQCYRKKVYIVIIIIILA